MRTLVGILAAVAIFIGVAMGMPPEMRKSWQALEQRAEAGDSDAQWRMAGVLERGFDSIAPDTLRAIDLVRRAADAGHPAAMNYLGYLYGEGKILSLSLDSSLYWLGRAAAGGDPKAAYNLAYRLLPDSSALPWLESAINAQLPQAQVLKGDLMAEGIILERDSAAASILYMSALTGGLLDAQLHLLNLEGPGIMQMCDEGKFERARELWRLGAYTAATEYLKAITERSPQLAAAYTLLGHAYSRGLGTEYDFAKGNASYALAAELGDPEAQNIISELLELFPDFKP